MTTTKQLELERRRRATESLLGFEDLLPTLEQRSVAANRLRWPSPRYREDPVGFFRDVLGIEPWSKQRDVLLAIRDHKRVAVKSGHRVSKSNTAAGIGLHHYSAWDDARCIMTATTEPQVNRVLWREVKMLFARSGRCVACHEEDPLCERIPTPCPHSARLDGVIGELARTGLKSGFRELLGLTAREAEGFQGFAGAHLRFIVDEASGVDDAIFEAIDGNSAGGASVVYFGNPTRTRGRFYECWNKSSVYVYGITISSEESPNVAAGKEIVPGLATREWVEGKKEEWGEDSALYRVRVKGEFALREDGKIFSLHAIGEAQSRWEETPPSGRLFVGFDPAGASGHGDEIVFAPRRGQKVLELHIFRGLTVEAHLVQLQVILKKHRIPRELPVVVVDREGSIGAELYGVLKSHLDSSRNDFELIGVRASDRAHRQPKIYDKVRDELAASLEAWMREGGAIPSDTKLEQELHLLEWEQAQNGRMKLKPAKPDVRKVIGRSPDRFDAVALSTWEPMSLKDEERRALLDDHEDDDDDGNGLDPHAGRGTFDPYGGR